MLFYVSVSAPAFGRSCNSQLATACLPPLPAADICVGHAAASSSISTPWGRGHRRWWRVPRRAAWAVWPGAKSKRDSGWRPNIFPGQAQKANAIRGGDQIFSLLSLDYCIDNRSVTGMRIPYRSGHNRSVANTMRFPP
jgi:hypothetical protein